MAQLPDIKKLKKLATACRKSGIHSLKIHTDGTLEFQLDTNFSPEQPKPVKAKQNPAQYSDGQFESDTLTEEQLMFYSSDPLVSEDSNSQ